MLAGGDRRQASARSAPPTRSLKVLKAPFRFPDGRAARFRMIQCHIWGTAEQRAYTIERRTNWRGIGRFPVPPGGKCVFRSGSATSQDLSMPDRDMTIAALRFSAAPNDGRPALY